MMGVILFGEVAPTKQRNACSRDISRRDDAVMRCWSVITLRGRMIGNGKRDVGPAGTQWKERDKSRAFHSGQRAKSRKKFFIKANECGAIRIGCWRQRKANR